MIELRRDEREPVRDRHRAGAGRGGPPRRSRVGPAGRPASAARRSGTVEHRRIDVDGRHPVAGGRERHGQPAASGGELEDRPVGPVGEGEVQVEVARIVDEVEVVQPGQRRRRRGIGSVEHAADERLGGRGRLPADRRRRRAGATARALIASRAARFAAIAVVSAWSYGGETSTMSIAGELDRADDLADRRAGPRA